MVCIHWKGLFFFKKKYIKWLCWLVGWPYAVKEAKYAGAGCETLHASVGIRFTVSMSFSS